MKYFVISISEDGDIRITEHSKKELERQMSGEDGYPAADDIREEIGEADPNYWGSKGTLIIKGEIVQPKAVEVVKRMELP